MNPRELGINLTNPPKGFYNQNVIDLDPENFNFSEQVETTLLELGPLYHYRDGGEFRLFIPEDTPMKKRMKTAADLAKRQIETDAKKLLETAKAINRLDAKELGLPENKNRIKAVGEDLRYSLDSHGAYLSAKMLGQIKSVLKDFESKGIEATVSRELENIKDERPDADSARMAVAAKEKTGKDSPQKKGKPADAEKPKSGVAADVQGREGKSGTGSKDLRSKEVPPPASRAHRDEKGGEASPSSLSVLESVQFQGKTYAILSDKKAYIDEKGQWKKLWAEPTAHHLKIFNNTLFLEIKVPVNEKSSSAWEKTGLRNMMWNKGRWKDWGPRLYENPYAR